MSDITFTIHGKQEIKFTHEDAVRTIIDFLRNPPKHDYGDFGYELYVDSLLLIFCKKEYGLDHNHSHHIIDKLFPLFVDGCWELCRRGILRPFPRDRSGQGTTRGAGFSNTAFGRQWLQEKDFDDYVPTEPDRFAKMLEPYSHLFGKGFQERAQEAVRCYNAHAYLACCAMAGAAAETILVTVSDTLLITRTKNEPITKTREKIISKSVTGIKERLIAYSDIVKYWRDEGMHHENWETRSEKAYISLAMLLRLAMFAREQWFEEH